MNTMTAKEIIQYMESLQNEAQREILMRFFKTGPGEYGEGDEFLGLKVPQTREVVRAVPKDFPLSEVPELLMNRWHEVRLCGLEAPPVADEARRKPGEQRSLPNGREGRRLLRT